MRAWGRNGDSKFPSNIFKNSQEIVTFPLAQKPRGSL